MAERLFRIHAVAELVGLSENLIRAWERRYRIVVPKRSPSGFRAYTEEDIEVLRRVKQQTEEGLSIGNVAPLVPELRKAIRAGAEAPPPLPVGQNQVEAWRAAILEAARQSDQARVERVLDEVLSVLPALAASEQVLMPVQVAVGEAWHAGELDVAQEHAVSHAVRVRLLRLVHGAPADSKRHVLCACFPDEQHDIGLLHAALKFRAAGFRVTWLGARTPTDDVVAMARHLLPDVVALSAGASVSTKALKSTTRAMREALPRKIRLVVGGAAALAAPEIVASAGARAATDDAWPALLA